LAPKRKVSNTQSRANAVLIRTTTAENPLFPLPPHYLTAQCLHRFSACILRILSTPLLACVMMMRVSFCFHKHRAATSNVLSCCTSAGGEQTSTEAANISRVTLIDVAMKKEYLDGGATAAGASPLGYLHLSVVRLRQLIHVHRTP